MKSPVPFSSPAMGWRERRAVDRVLKSGWLTTGDENRLFEEEFSRFTGAGYALTVNSATSALHLILEALGVGLDDWVITTPYTFTASSEILRYLGAHPLFADIDEETGNIDPAEIQRILETNSKLANPGVSKPFCRCILPGWPAI